jgi:hypothetical protein
MRDLKKTDRNRIAFRDGVSDTVIVMFYSTPSASQIKAYRQQSIRRKGNKVVMDTFDPAMRFGLDIITGFEDGAFGYDGKPISSDTESPNYRSDWKDLLKEVAADIVTMVAAVAFDGVKMSGGESEFEFEGEAAEEVPPLARS